MIPGCAPSKSLECPDDWVPRECFFERQPRIDSGKAGLVREQPPHGNLVLAVRTEFRPVLDDRCVQIKVPALNEHVSTDRGRALGRRCNLYDGVFVPAAIRLTVGEASPEVGDGAAADVDAARRADVTRVSFEVRSERIGHLAPPGCNVPLHGYSTRGTCHRSLHVSEMLYVVALLARPVAPLRLVFVDRVLDLTTLYVGDDLNE